MSTILEIRSWVWSHSLCYHEVVVEIVNSRLGVAYCAYNHQKMNQDRCRKTNFQMLTVHKSLELDDELDPFGIYRKLQSRYYGHMLQLLKKCATYKGIENQVPMCTNLEWAVVGCTLGAPVGAYTGDLIV